MACGWGWSFDPTGAGANSERRDSISQTDGKNLTPPVSAGKDWSRIQTYSFHAPSESNSQGHNSQANNNEAARQSPFFTHQHPLAFPLHLSCAISAHRFGGTLASYAEKRHIRRAAGTRMPCAFTIGPDPADLAGTFRGGSRLLLATLHSGRAGRAAGSPFRSLFSSAGAWPLSLVLTWFSERAQGTGLA